MKIKTMNRSVFQNQKTRKSNERLGIERNGIDSGNEYSTIILLKMQNLRLARGDSGVSGRFHRYASIRNKSELVYWPRWPYRISLCLLHFWFHYYFGEIYRWYTRIKWSMMWWVHHSHEPVKTSNTIIEKFKVCPFESSQHCVTKHLWSHTFSAVLQLSIDILGLRSSDFFFGCNSEDALNRFHPIFAMEWGSKSLGRFVLD